MNSLHRRTSSPIFATFVHLELTLAVVMAIVVHGPPRYFPAGSQAPADYGADFLQFCATVLMFPGNVINARVNGHEILGAYPWLLTFPSDLVANRIMGTTPYLSYGVFDYRLLWFDSIGSFEETLLMILNSLLWGSTFTWLLRRTDSHDDYDEPRLRPSNRRAVAIGLIAVCHFLVIVALLGILHSVPQALGRYVIEPVCRAHLFPVYVGVVLPISLIPHGFEQPWLVFALQAAYVGNSLLWGYALHWLIRRIANRKRQAQSNG